MRSNIVTDLSTVTINMNNNIGKVVNYDKTFLPIRK